ncbi:MAG: hypothetical protein LBL41_03440, partial [Bifidobacteriaceae bacterium]|nr:hypothetical protein [Bifidobacteriaceae bacterium]
LDETNAADDLIEVKGDKIPNSGDATRPVEIQVGLPGVDNSSLPEFRIPSNAAGDGGLLGDGNTSYSGSRFVVNDGAYFNIYIATPASYPDFGKLMGGYTGGFNSGNITVRQGGILRDGSLTAWPLGTGSTITARWGSSVLIGPGDRYGNDDSWVKAALDSQGFSYGFFVAPNDKDSIAVWSSEADKNDGYIDIGIGVTGEVNVNANLTVKKGLGLTYRLFIRVGRVLTIDIPDTALATVLDAEHGIYGVAASSPSGDAADAASRIVVNQGTLKGRSYSNPAESDITVNQGGTPVVLENGGTGSLVDSIFTGVSGYLDWTETP